MKIRYWWVNHKKTHTAEIRGGYIWSPKANSNGAKNQTYLNLTLAHPGDTVFSYADAKLKAVGLVTGWYREESKPLEFGIRGDSWADTGWYVPISWVILEQPISPKKNILAIEHMLPTKNSPIQKNGNGNQVCYLASISDELAQTLTSLISNENADFSEILSNWREQTIEDVEEDSINSDKTIQQTEKEQLVKARRGQGYFRNRVEKIEKYCRVTKVDSREFLIASHIKPWRVSDNTERLDGNNGLMLSPHIDKLFDRGWISFEDKGQMIVATTKIKNLLGFWGVKFDINVGYFNSSQRSYLNYHRSNIFKSSDF